MAEETNNNLKSLQEIDYELGLNGREKEYFLDEEIYPNYIHSSSERDFDLKDVNELSGNLDINEESNEENISRSNDQKIIQKNESNNKDKDSEGKIEESKLNPETELITDPDPDDVKKKTDAERDRKASYKKNKNQPL